MRVILYIVLALVVLGGLAFAFFAFLATGGFDRWEAERDVAARGVDAAEPVTAVGFNTLKIPKGWRRDTFGQYLQDNFGGVPRDGGGPATVYMASANDASIDFTLGGYSHIGGRVTMSRLTLFARAPSAPNWSPTEDPSDTGMRAWVQLGAEGQHIWYMRQGNLEDDRGYQLLTVDLAKRMRAELNSTKDLYDRAQAVALSRSVLDAAMADMTAVDAGRAAYLARRQAIQDAALATMAALAGPLGRDAPLTQGLNAASVGSYVFVDGTSAEAQLRLKELPLDGKPVEAAQRALTLSEAQIRAALGRTGPDVDQVTRAPGIYAVWICDDRICARDIRYDSDGSMRTDPASGELPRAVWNSLAKDRLYIYRIGQLYLADQAAALQWLADAGKLKAIY
jgi:hypothetical protein